MKREKVKEKVRNYNKATINKGSEDLKILRVMVDA